MKQMSLQMKQGLEQLQSTGASSSDQLRNQQETMSLQIDKFTDVAKRHDDEMDDMKALQEFTHELVLEREQKESM